MTEPPKPDVALRLAELIAPLPLASVRALACVRAVALPSAVDDPGEDVRGIWALRALDWLPIYAHFGRTRGWLSARVRALPAAELLALLEQDLGQKGQPAGAERPKGAVESETRRPGGAKLVPSDDVSSCPVHFVA